MKGTSSRKPGESLVRRKRKRLAANTRKSYPAYQEGYRLGYEGGVEAGTKSYGALLDGTSIVIPTFNQLAYLRECIDSIKAHTEEPYEIIVVDNASTDGTAEYLESRSSWIRSTVLNENRGFAGGINYGLMMARGKYIVMLNNDTVVTPGWLSHMLSCLKSDESIAAVGPVTNYIGGDQQIEVPYKRIKDMWKFAEGYRMPDPSKWRETDRLVGFCLLFRRNLISEVGYLDEGYQIGNYEDEDWNIRIRLLNRKLVVAGDSFIHHYGSVSMKKLADQFEQTNEQNAKFYTSKWGNPHDLIHRTKRIIQAGNMPVWKNRHAYHFYPVNRMVQSATGTLYWLADGVKHQVKTSGDESITSHFRKKAVTLSRPELWNIPSGEVVHANSERELLAMMRVQGKAFGLPEGSILAENVLHANSELYQLHQGKRRPFATRYAAACWSIGDKDIHVLPSHRIHALPLGLPIIAPPVIRNPL
ncbi:glycosyltransferase family 2 protein [Paenibacillus sp. Marseille-Q4541]|uniref:glycosyltransferase family 2 protein n=1 Tax=Paenibacillus sp. Marseille-Q4541 TaxID=2831522 RepID=UPI001BA45CB2|nr:glycosyltransferase family 2 protein [Paenibacillus sp. Marseille-Q4541]